MRRFVSYATSCIAVLIATTVHAEELVACPPASIRTQIREASGSSIDAMMSAIAFMEHRYGPPHSRRRVSDDEVRMIYRSGTTAVAVSLARDESGRIATDCITYRRAGSQ